MLVHDEVRDAIAEGRAVVALESTKIHTLMTGCSSKRIIDSFRSIGIDVLTAGNEAGVSTPQITHAERQPKKLEQHASRRQD